MAEKQRTTTIRVSPEVKECIYTLAIKGDSLDDVLRTLLEMPIIPRVKGRPPKKAFDE